MTFSDLKKFSQDFVQNLYIKSLVQGNVSKDHAVEVATNFVNALESASIPSDNYPMVSFFGLLLKLFFVVLSFSWSNR